MKRDRMGNIEKQLLNDCEYQNGITGYRGGTISQRYFDEIWNGHRGEYYYDYN